MPDFRAHFDFDIRFANGGALAGTGFRLDLPSADVSEDEIGRLLVQHLGLALVDEVELRGLRVVEEEHRGSRGVAAAAATGVGTRVVDLSHPIRAGLVTYPGLPAPTITPHLTREDSRARYAPGTEFAMDILTMIGNTGTYLDSPFHRYADGSDLAGLDLGSLLDLVEVEILGELLHAWGEHLLDADFQRAGGDRVFDCARIAALLGECRAVLDAEDQRVAHLLRGPLPAVLPDAEDPRDGADDVRQQLRDQLRWNLHGEGVHVW